ncbi:MAG TPA: alginate lyase family protein, partial [Candidatus Krumholzibacteria bacterium]|nr:alginate lyase family protein [Candidatus Krumholzibacteria bacterium]
MRPPLLDRRSSHQPRSTIATTIAFGLAASLGAAIATPLNGAPDEADPRSVEWVCAHAPERVSLLFDSLNLDRPALSKVKQAVLASDYPAACHALLQYYRTAPSAKWLRHPVVKESRKDDARADAILSDELEFYGERATVPRTAAGGLDWTYAGPRNDPEWNWSLNWMGYLGPLTAGYFKTGRRDYVERIDQDVRDWILANPRPSAATRAGGWRGLEVATRVGNWKSVFYGLQAVDEFSPAARILMLSSLVEHAQHLMLFHRRDANNWTVSEMNALGTVGCAWPEFRDAGGWRAYSQENIGRLAGELVYPDGAEAELTSGYHRIATETFDGYVDTFRRFGYPVADSIAVDIKRMWTYLAYTLRPDGTSPQNNDSDRSDIREKLTAAAMTYDRPDWSYIASNGREGNRPRIGPSVTFPWAGHAVMRNGWGADAHWAFFDAGPFGVAHQHRDKLHLSIDAFGRPLLVDTGRFTYSEGPQRDYFAGSAGHNVLLIDGAGQNKTPERAQRPMPGGDYGSTAELDFARGIFDAGFSGTKGRAVHTRTVVYIKDRFWIVADRVETDRSRTVEALWHFAPD